MNERDLKLYAFLGGKRGVPIGATISEPSSLFDIQETILVDNLTDNVEVQLETPSTD